MTPRSDHSRHSSCRGDSAVSARVLHEVFRDVRALDLETAGRAVRAVTRWGRQMTCGLTGHDYFVRLAGNRIFLRCADCDHETPGWSIDIRVPRRSLSSGHVPRSQSTAEPPVRQMRAA